LWKENHYSTAQKQHFRTTGGYFGGGHEISGGGDKLVMMNHNHDCHQLTARK
jgi:hypothetical protein